MLQHPEIAWVERTGYPSWAQEDSEENAEDSNDAYESYCDRMCEEKRECECLGK